MIDWLRPDWPAPPHVHAASCCRRGGISRAPYDSLNLATHVGDDPLRVAGNRQRLRTQLQLPAEPVWLNQVHGCAALRLPCGPTASTTADAAWTTEPATVCAVLTADCLPILLCDVDGRCVAVVHAGWRGLAAGIVEQTLQALPVASDRMIAWLGPAIGPAAFVVGAEVHQAFVDADAAASAAFSALPADGKYLADLFQLARLRLAAAGVQAVHGGGVCTVTCAADYYSYRRDGRCGRMATLIWMTPA